MSRYRSPWGNPALAEESATHQVSTKIFLASVCVALAAGLATSIAVAKAMNTQFNDSPYEILAIGAGAILVFAGLEICVRNPSWLVSLAGHVVVSTGLGVAISPVIDTPLQPALHLTLLGILMTAVLSVLAPKVVHGWGSFVLISATTLLLLQVAPRALGWSSAPIHFGHHIFGLLFLAHLDYYLTRACSLPRTLDNIVDTASAVYVDIVNQAALIAQRFRKPLK